MSFLRFTTLLACILIIGGGITPSQAAAAQKNSFMRVHGQALPPFGFVQFCQRYKTDCNRVDDVSFARFDADVNHLSELDLVNRSINTRIKPVTDMELYGREEFWTYPTNQGDCEDYVVLKRRILMSRGWPSSALLITVVRDENDDGHAVLTVRTKQGDYVLDNKVDTVRLWSQTPYKYLMRQSYLNPKLWMALDPRTKHSNGSVATTE